MDSGGEIWTERRHDVEMVVGRSESEMRRKKKGKLQVVDWCGEKEGKKGEEEIDPRICFVFTGRGN